MAIGRVRMKIGEQLANTTMYMRQIIAQIVSYLSILTPLTVLLGSSGLLLNVSPMFQSLSILFGPFFLCAFIGLILELSISVFLEFRGFVKRCWQRNTPPYIQSEISKLPVLDRSVSKSIEKAIKCFLWSLVLYLISLLTAVYIAISRPPEITRLAESPLTDVGVALIVALFQIPSVLLDVPYFAQFIPQSGTEFDMTILVLLLVVPIPTMIILMSNLKFVLERDHNRVYWTVINKIQKNRADGSALMSEIRIEHFAVLLWDFVATFFIASYIGVNFA